MMPERASGDYLARTTLIIGGARSGKSEFAESLLADHVGQRVYVATAEAHDDEMAKRIAVHRARRIEGFWHTIEAPLTLSSVLGRQTDPSTAILVDCLTLWISNLMGASRNVRQEIERFVSSLQHLEGRVVFVTNEVGLGIVPENPMARTFRDHAGHLNQLVAAKVEQVILVVAGLPLVIKP